MSEKLRREKHPMTSVTVGDAVTAMDDDDPEGTLFYKISGRDAAPFTINPETGQISTK